MFSATVEVIPEIEMTLKRQRIFVTQVQNDKYFGQKLPTWRNGYCYIEREITRSKDPSNVWEWYGTIRSSVGRLTVHSGDGEAWDIERQ